VQNEGADYQHSDGPHGCEVPSDYNNALGSFLPKPLQVIPGDALHSYFLYRNCFVFLAVLRHCILLFLGEAITVLVNGMSYCLFDLGLRCTTFLVRGQQHIPFISIISQQKVSTL